MTNEVLTDVLTGEFDAAEVRALGAQLMSKELIVFPVRHHSPACALQLRRLFAACRPCVVLVEGPRSFSALIPALTHADTRAPFAVYTYAVHQMASGDDAKAERRQSAYYPFCDYSPELVALREAKRLDIPARFIDLDFAEQSRLEAQAIRDDEHEARSLLDERQYRRSRYLQALAGRIGCRDHEELWEHLFETCAPDLTLEKHIAHVAAYCALARQDSDKDALHADGTAQREAEMAWHVQEALSERGSDSGPVLAVMGGFHAVAMTELLRKGVQRPKLARVPVPDAHSALIRYSFDRLDRLNGYGAGMTSPAWHQRLWEQMIKHDKAGVTGVVRLRREVSLATLYEIAAALRERHAVALPMPALAAAYEQALRLASLRGRAAPVRDDVMDAVISCFVKGDADADGVLVRAVALQVLSGQQLGAVPAGIGTPLVKDFELRARRQRLKIDASERRRLVLDIYRRPEHRVTSRLLHGLALLDVPFAVRTAGPDFVSGIGLERLQEHWEYTSSPMTESALIENSVYGVTVPQAVANRFLARLDRLREQGLGSDARTAASNLVHACVLGLHDHLPRVLSLLREAVAADAAFDAVAAAANSVGLLWESREPLEARGVSELQEVMRSAYERAIYLGGDVQGSAGVGDARVKALVQLRELLRSAAGAQLDEGIYWTLVNTLYRSDSEALVRGAAAGLLYACEKLTEDALSATLNGHLDGLLQPRDAVGFLRGLLQTAREVAWQQSALLGVLDDLLSRWDEADFVANLPELRLAFAEMTPRETDRISEMVARMHGQENLGTLVRHDLSAEQLQANLQLSQALREVLLADGLAGWGQP